MKQQLQMDNHVRWGAYLLYALSLVASAGAYAGGTYQEPDAFITDVFNGDPPKPGIMWLDKDIKKQMAEILAHPYKGLRVRYWASPDASRTAWILEEIGKEKPITTGFVVEDGRIQRVKVLVFRESRGWEVRHSFFTDQFLQAELRQEYELSKNIDNISGATLSVRALTKLAKIALLLDARVQAKRS